MASVFRTRDRKSGKLHRVWRFKYKDTLGRWRYGTGWPDRQKTLDHAQSVEAEHRAIRKGEKEAPPSYLANRNKPISEVISDYLAWGRTQGGRYGRPWDGQNARLKEIGLEWWLKELGLTVLADIDLFRVEKALQTLGASGLAPKTLALRVESLRSLCCWSVKRGLMAENPLRGLARFDTRPQVPHRSLTDEEIAALLNAATPAHRLWYETGLQTGFRLNELRCVRVKDLDPFGPSIQLAADFSKDRKDHRQFITKDLSNKLAQLATGKNSDDRLLGIPKGPDPATYISDDFRAADIKIVTDDGKASWHSLRKVFINNVIKSGADLKTVMELARHSSATMSMDVYAKAKPELLRKAVAAAAETIDQAVAASACCTGVAQQVVGGNKNSASACGVSVKVISSRMGDTGFEPVTLSLSS